MDRITIDFESSSLHQLSGRAFRINYGWRMDDLQGDIYARARYNGLQLVRWTTSTFGELEYAYFVPDQPTEVGSRAFTNKV